MSTVLIENTNAAVPSITTVWTSHGGPATFFGRMDDNAGGTMKLWIRSKSDTLGRWMPMTNGSSQVNYDRDLGRLGFGSQVGATFEDPSGTPVNVFACIEG